MKQAQSSNYLISRKITLDNKSKLSSSIIDYFNNPTNYFNYKIDDKIVGINKHFFLPTGKHKGSLSLIDLRNIRRKTKDFNDEDYKTDHFNSKNSLFPAIIPRLKRDRRFINTMPNENKQLHEIFAYFEKKKQDNILKRLALSKENSLYKTSFNQTKTLEIQSSNKEANDLLIDLIAQKTKRLKTDLLMNKSQSFRYKREMQQELDKDLQNKKEMCSSLWPFTLRNEIPTHIKHCFNSGTPRSPKLEYLSKKEDYEQEKVYSLSMKNTKEIAKISSFLDNSYLKKRITNKVRFNLQKSMNNHSLNFALIKGKDLLEFEKEASKNMKLKKPDFKGWKELLDSDISFIFDKKTDYKRSDRREGTITNGN